MEHFLKFVLVAGELVVWHCREVKTLKKYRRTNMLLHCLGMKFVSMAKFVRLTLSKRMDCHLAVEGRYCHYVIFYFFFVFVFYLHFQQFCYYMSMALFQLPTLILFYLLALSKNINYITLAVCSIVG